MKRALPINCAARYALWSYSRVAVSRFPGAPTLVEPTRSYEMPDVVRLPAESDIAVELWGGAVRFRLDGVQHRLYIRRFTYAAFESDEEARAALLELWHKVERLESIKEVETAAEAWLSVHQR